MNKCCKETYKQTLEEILIHINMVGYKSIHKLRITLEHAISILNEKKEIKDER